MLNTHGFTFSARRAGQFALGLAISASVFVAGGRALPISATPNDDLGAPTLLAAQLDGSTALITFQDHSSVEDGFIYSARPTVSNVPVLSGDLRGPVPGEGRTATATVTGLTPNIGYCFSVYAWRLTDLARFDRSDDSNQICVDPAAQAMQADLWVERIGLEDGRPLPPNAELPLLIKLRNSGADAIGNVEFTIWTSGAVTISRFTFAPTNAGPCTPITVNGANAAFHCTGFTDRAGEDANHDNPVAWVTTAGSGMGQVVMALSLSPTSGQTLKNPANGGHTTIVIVGGQ